jgi:rare lipoprotein A
MTVQRVELQPPARLVRAGTLLTIATMILSACAQSQLRREHEPVPTTSDVPPPAAPAVPSAPPQQPARRGNPPFYDVLGQRYHVLSSGEGYHQRGVASWYWREFHGRSTASGEPYDMNALTAAHKTLPLPSYARVTNLRNGRSIVVRINDRGPFVRNRILDLSYAAAQALDIANEGTGIVDIETVVPDTGNDAVAASAAPADPVAAVLPDADAAHEPPLESRTLYVQVGAFGDPFNAERMHQRLAALGFDNVSVVPEVARDRPLYRVRLGPLADVASYDRLVDRLHSVAIDDIYLTLN